jgi:cbb3-type cytochrome oxidase maturation protein
VGATRPLSPERMDILYLLIPLSIVLVFVIGVVFWWSVHAGQFDDLEGPAHRILQDDDSVVRDDKP